MPLFETAIPVNAEEIEKIVSQNWKLKLGKLIKASQNHTFQAFSEDGQKKYSVRVTPDPEKKHIKRVSDQLFFVNYLIKAGLNHLCSPIAPLTESEHKTFLVVGDLIIAVFEWAQGSPLGFVQFRWMRDNAVIRAWGRFFAQMHKISRTFSKEHPEIVKRIQKWDEIHCSILKGTKISPEDEAVADDPQHYGVLHGDLNTSNIHYVDEKDILSVYDTDQVQVGWYLFDVAQACFTIIMLESGGMPMSGAKVEGANPKEFIDTIIEGYESQGEKVDRDRLFRMIEVKKQLYLRFSKQALIQGNVPKDMEAFLIYVRNHLEPNWKGVQ